MLRLLFCLIIRHIKTEYTGVDAMNIKALIIKHLKNTLRKREFWFTILIYPAIAAGYFYIKNYPVFLQLVGKTHIWYFIIAFIFFVYITCYVAFEVIEKRLHHKVQGDKLKIKQEQNRR
jgi:predicted permease